VGGGVVEDLFFFTVPGDALSCFVGDHAEEGEDGGAVGGLDVAGGLFAGFDGFEEVCPKDLHVVTVGFLELRILVHFRFLGIGGVEGPSVSPAHVKDAFGAVEIAADGVLFGVITGVFAVFPGGGEVFELPGADLGIGSVGGLFFVVEDGFAADGAASGAVDVFGVEFIGPPEELVHPVNTPVGHGAVAEVEEVAPASGMNPRAKGA